MSYCTSCGSKVTVEMLFCHNCGSKLAIPTVASERPEPQETTPDTAVNNREAIPDQEPVPSRDIKRNKLYKQWVRYAGLPTEKILPKMSLRERPVRRESSGQHPRLFYVLLIAGILVCVGLGILLAKIW